MQSSQSQDLRTLARVKRKREEQSAHRQLSHRAAADSLSGTATSHARSMASFIQSALGSEGGDGEGEGWRAVEEDEGGTSRPTTGGGSASVTGGKAPSRGGKRKRGATAKRRPGLGVRSKRGRLSAAAVRWPGFEEEGEGEEEGSSSDIQGYSDSEEEDLREDDTEDAPSQSDDIQDYLDQTTDSVRDRMKWAGPRQVVPRRRKGHGSGTTVGQWAVATSTPSHRRGHTDCLAERMIDDFESPSSEDDAPYHSHPASPPSPSAPLHLHPITISTTTSRTVTRRTKPLIGRGLPVSPIECASTPEDMRIATPPSSPEVVASVSDFNRTKTSDWIKQVQLESAESSRGDLNDTAKTPHQCQHQYQCHSESSKRGSGRGKRFIPGGLAEQLQRVSRCEASETTVWEYRVKRLEGKDEDTDGCVTVHVLSLANSHSLFIARCQVLKGSPLPQACGQTGRQTQAQLLEAENSTQESSQFSTQSPPRGRANVVYGCSRHGTSLRAPAVESDGVSDLESRYHGMETQPESLEENRLDSAEGGAVRSGMRPEDEDGTRTAQELLQIRECGRITETASTSVTDGTAHPLPRSCQEQEVTVLFSLRWAGLLGLCVGSCVRIRPPWQCLSLPSSSLHRHVLLCTNFCQSLGQVPLPHPPTCPAPAPPFSPLPPCRQKGVEGVYGLVSPEKVRSTPHSLLIKSPVKALQPMRLFSDQDEARTPIKAHQIVHEAATHHHSDSITMVTTPPMDRTNSSDLTALMRTIVPGRPREIKPCTLAEAMEHAHRGLVSFTARVQRVYRKKVPARQGGGESTSPQLSLRQSFLQHAKLQQAGPPVACKIRWVLLVCDSSRVFSEIQLTEDTPPPWCDLVKLGEGRAYHFVNVRVTQRMNPSRNPGVFSLLSSLKVGSMGTDGSQTSLERDSPLPSGPSPSFCYALLCRADSRAVPCPGTEQLVALPGKEEQPLALSPLTTAPSTAGDSELRTSAHRTSILARVVQIQLEVAVETDDEGHPSLQEPRPLCGYFLFVITNAGTGVADSNCSQATIRVYLKPSFCVAGLWKVLSTPGSKVLLRDVLCGGNGTPEVRYCMDACSMAMPVRAGDLEPGLVDLEPGLSPYPWRSFTIEELHLLDTLSSPPLPPLSQDTAKQGTLVRVTGVVVGVAEDQAYSWPACSTCGNSRLVALDDSDSSELYCDECEKATLSPSIHMQLAVFLHCPLLGSHTVSVQLLQSTIHDLLPVTETSIKDGFDIHCVLSRAVSLHACYIMAARDTADGKRLLCLKEVDVQFRD